jgi:uncharacterized repeat protein (TIGR03806 family)
MQQRAKKAISIVLISLVLACSQREVDKAVLWDPSGIIAAKWQEKSMDELDFAAIPLKKLSDYGFFKGTVTELDPNEGVLPYEPAASLFTDYAYKSRFIWMPNGSTAKINADEEGTMEFPENTILIKNFYYPLDFSQPEGTKRIIETRLMVKQNGSWEAYPYIWKDDQTDAEYKVVGAERTVHWKREDGQMQVINYLVPNKNQCKSCHNSNEEMVPIGVKAKHLNHSIAFSDGESNQLVKWASEGMLDGFEHPETYPKMVDYLDNQEPLELRAKAYLDINCAHCHRAEGPASTSGLFLTYEEKEPLKLGIFKTPVAAGFGAGNFKYAIFPGKADESIITFRMETNIVGAAMPEIGRVTAHREGLDLIKNWINGMNVEAYQ